MAVRLSLLDVHRALAQVGVRVVRVYWWRPTPWSDRKYPVVVTDDRWYVVDDSGSLTEHVRRMRMQR